MQLGLGQDLVTGGSTEPAFQIGDALLLGDGVSFLLLGGGTDKLLLAPQ